MVGSEPQQPSSRCTRGCQHNVHIIRFTTTGHCLALPMLKPISVPTNRSWPEAIHRDDAIVVGLDRTCRERPPDLTFALLEILYCLGGWHRDCGSGSLYNPSDGRPSPCPGQWCIVSCPLPIEQIVEHILDHDWGMEGTDLRTFLMTPIRPSPILVSRDTISRALGHSSAFC